MIVLGNETNRHVANRDYRAGALSPELIPVSPDLTEVVKVTDIAIGRALTLDIQLPERLEVRSHILLLRTVNRSNRAISRIIWNSVLMRPSSSKMDSPQMRRLSRKRTSRPFYPALLISCSREVNMVAGTRKLSFPGMNRIHLSSAC